jgi:23S rRNA (guanosine2251-2'-O)-methyltransferase
VRRLLKEKSDELVRIPMRGKVQSLNVNIAAAILLYEAIRQRGDRRQK